MEASTELATSIPGLIIASAAIFAGATVQGAVGFGLSLVAAPVLLLIDPHYVPGPLLAVSILLTLLILGREHRHVEIHHLGPVLLGRLPGTAIGLWLLVSLAPRAMNLTFGALILSAVAMSATRARLQPTRPALMTAGLLSGVMSMTTSAGGPPLAIVYQSTGGATLRATLSGHFLIGAAISLIALGGGGRLGDREALLAGILLPGLLAGFWLSGRLHRRLDAGRTRTAVLCVSGAAGAAVILRALFA